MSELPQEVPIHGIAAGGAGVGRLDDGRAVFVHGTAPGDTAVVTLTAERPRWARARLSRVKSPGPDRAAPPCDYYGICGGCTLQHLTYPAQLDAKRRMVEGALSRIAGAQVQVGAVDPSPSALGYRNRITLTLKRLRSGRVVAGMHELERPSRVFDLDGPCLLADPTLQGAWHELRRAWGGGARNLPEGGELRLTLRKANEGVVLSIRGGKGRGRPEAILEGVGELVAIWHTRDRERPILLAGAADTTESWMDAPVAVRSAGFLQVNRAAGERLHRRVLDVVRRFDGSVVDAYCGVGTLGRALAQEGRTVVGIEAEAEAVAAARVDAPKGFTVLEGRVEERLADVLPSAVVLVNPPRAGLDVRVVDALLEQKPSAVVYVSCDPATLARDVSRLQGGFGIRSAEAFDLFPQTAHVETVLLLTPEGFE